MSVRLWSKARATERDLKRELDCIRPVGHIVGFISRTKEARGGFQVKK